MHCRKIVVPRMDCWRMTTTIVLTCDDFSLGTNQSNLLLRNEQASLKTWRQIPQRLKDIGKKVKLYRSSPQTGSVKNAFYKLRITHRKTPVPESLFSKVTGQRPFLIEHLRWLLLAVSFCLLANVFSATFQTCI